MALQIEDFQDKCHLSDCLDGLSIENLSIEDFNMPDLNRFPDIFDKIFGYLNTENLCDASLVCSSWYNFIAKSSKLMKSFRLCIDLSKETEGEENIFGALMDFKRIFSSIKIKNSFTPCNDIVRFMKNYQWIDINLDMQCVKFPDLPLECLEKTVSIKVGALELFYVENLILSAPNLKHLKLTLCSMTSYDWSKLQGLQLESLTLCLTFGVSYRARTVNSFILSQIKSLQSLELQGIVLSVETFEMIMAMPKLKSLQFNKLFINMDFSKLNLKEMKNLEKLIIRDDSPAMNQLVYNFLWSTPNLTLLEIPFLDQTYITHAGYRLNKLEELHTGELQEFSDSLSPDLFPQLDIIRVRKRMTTIQRDKIKKDVHVQLNNFTLCLYEETTRKPHTLSQHYVILRYLNSYSRELFIN